jgi:hypothetical protein
MNVKSIKRRTRVVALVAVSLLFAGAIAGTASGSTLSWQQIWDQIRPLLADPGTINSSDNPVHWTKLKGVPAGLADGLDNGVDRAGFGLTKNLVPNLEFAVDTTKIQRRISGTCPGNEAVQSIGADGTVTCSSGVAGAVVYQGWDEAANGQEPIGNNWASVGAGALNLPAGTFSLVATLNVSAGFDGEGSGDFDWLYCNLEAWVDQASSGLDSTQVGLDDPPQGGAELPIALTGVFTSSKPWRAAVVCKDSWDGSSEHDTDVSWENIKITATQVGELHTQRLQ